MAGDGKLTYKYLNSCKLVADGMDEYKNPLYCVYTAPLPEDETVKPFVVETVEAETNAMLARIDKRKELKKKQGAVGGGRKGEATAAVGGGGGGAFAGGVVTPSSPSAASTTSELTRNLNGLRVGEDDMDIGEEERKQEMEDRMLIERMELSLTPPDDEMYDDALIRQIKRDLAKFERAQDGRECDMYKQLIQRLRSLMERQADRRRKSRSAS